MNIRFIVIAAVAVLLGGFWFLKSGKAKLFPQKEEAALKCARAECGEEFTMQLPRTFNKFPVKCPKCGEMSGYPMVTCSFCLKAYAFDPKNPPEKCPNCGAELPH
jgi:DNA-directed RNA polymerase subunit RPC12/RpoP